jgi:hypothetical protein
MADRSAKRRVRLELHLDDSDRQLLEGALLAAKAAELAEVQRRTGRLSYGYGSDSAREDMNAVVVDRRRRKELIEALLAALARADADGAGTDVDGPAEVDEPTQVRERA